ncbi:MAM and LDL-receptor class A domain-containing protein 1-like [Watersipora subatra]|uniref:MAM and LDL-receptor class A domain-containing protein 1-like n=1 Tax=Watersipora subatra TaxID=2589382 RepID=UPI00355C51C4
MPICIQLETSTSTPVVQVKSSCIDTLTTDFCLKFGDAACFDAYISFCQKTCRVCQQEVSMSRSRLTYALDTAADTPQGKYLYLETSSPRVSGDNALYVSTSLSATNGSCLSFWYHMNGSNIGQLNLYLRKTGSKWLQSKVGIKSATPYSVVIEGVRGNGIQGDIAIDDITFSSTAFCTSIAGGATPSTTIESPRPTTLTTASKIDCNFDSGLCGWIQLKGDQFDWTRQNNPTSTGGTGPGKDHTSGSGYYLYIETSSPRSNNDKAQLQSPIIAKQKAGQYCFSFWYHMWGQHIETLNVYAQRQGSNGKPVWTRNGNQGNAWKLAEVAIDATSDFKIVIEGVRGASYAGDIAIDDFSLSPGSCKPANADACGFESPNLCGWTQMKNDNFDWSLQSGLTSSSNTGPSKDHSTQTGKGFYLYTETSKTNNGWKAALLSPKFSYRTDKCASLWYHMYGNDIGTLQIYLVIGKTSKLLWSSSGNKGDKWLLTRMNIPSPAADWNLKVVATVGSGYHGDMVIDDFSLTDGLCSGTQLTNSTVTPSNVAITTTTSKPPTTTPSKAPTTIIASTASPFGNINCNFDKGLCGWVQDLKDKFNWKSLNKPTSTSRTGPTSDHTSGKGKYLYIETSSPRKRNDRATLNYQFPKPISTGCFSMYHHMYGSNVGTLQVTGRDATGKLATLWRKSRTQGNKWLKMSISITKNISMIAINGIVGSGIRGDIAIDDIMFSPTPCEQAVSGQLKDVTKLSCGFDSSFCGWKAISSIQGQQTFMLTSPSSSPPQGPDVDFNTGTKNGKYLGLPANKGTKTYSAKLISPVVTKPKGAICLTFAYSILSKSPSSADLLSIGWQRNNSTTSPSSVASGFGFYTPNKWRLVQYTINAMDDFMISIEAVKKVGTPYLAIDAINVKPGSCPAAGSYAYIESSSATVSGDNAILLTPMADDKISTSQCLQFWYHMYGINVGSLKVIFSIESSAGSYQMSDSIVWSLSSSQSNKWMSASIPFNSKSRVYQFKFQGIVGNGAAGDIAIDDVAIRLWTCSLKPVLADPNLGSSTTIVSTSPTLSPSTSSTAPFS